MKRNKQYTQHGHSGIFRSKLHQSTVTEITEWAIQEQKVPGSIPARIQWNVFRYIRLFLVEIMADNHVHANTKGGLTPRTFLYRYIFWCFKIIYFKVKHNLTIETISFHVHRHSKMVKMHNQPSWQFFGKFFCCKTFLLWKYFSVIFLL